MTPSADDLRALARSSPWLWTTVHLVQRTHRQEVEARVRRPDLVRARRVGEPERVQRSERGQGTAVLVTAYLGDGSPPAQPPQRVRPRAADVEPSRRPDGLVAERPSEWEVDYDEMVWQDYRFAAMLDPHELAAGVDITQTRSEPREGRETWWGRMVAVEGYDPQCSCCPLLWSEASDLLEGESMNWRLGRPQGPWPSAYDVGLDRATGIVVSVQPVDVLLEGEQSLEVSILEVDGPVEG